MRTNRTRVDFAEVNPSLEDFPETRKEKLARYGKRAWEVGSTIAGTSIRVGDNSEGEALEEILAKDYLNEFPKDFSSSLQIPNNKTRKPIDFAEVTPLKGNYITQSEVEPNLEQLSPVSESLDREAKIGNILIKPYK